MKLTHEEWSRIETQFRAHACKWFELQSRLYDDDRYRALAKASQSPEAFATQWKRSIGPGNSLDIAEVLSEGSRRFRKPDRVIEHASEMTTAELKYDKAYRANHGQSFRVIRNQEDEEEFLNKAHELMRWRPTMVIDHAFYALYIAWRPDSRIIVPDNRPGLLRALAVDDSLLRAIPSREFEELIAYVYESLGCRVELTKQSRDFGADILAWHGGPLSSELLIAVQVKRYAKHRKVGIKQVFELHGAVSHYHADSGHVVTSSDFSAPARQFATQHRYHLVNMRKLQEEILGLFGDS